MILEGVKSARESRRERVSEQGRERGDGERDEERRERERKNRGIKNKGRTRELERGELGVSRVKVDRGR